MGALPMAFFRLENWIMGINQKGFEEDIDQLHSESLNYNMEKIIPFV